MKVIGYSQAGPIIEAPKVAKVDALDIIRCGGCRVMPFGLMLATGRAGEKYVQLDAGYIWNPAEAYWELGDSQKERLTQYKEHGEVARFVGGFCGDDWIKGIYPHRSGAFRATSDPREMVEVICPQCGVWNEFPSHTGLWLPVQPAFGRKRIA